MIPRLCFALWILLSLTWSLSLAEGPKENLDLKTENGNGTEDNQRAGKIFSLFSVVTFKNTGCRSQSTMSTGQSSVRNGTCYTSSECTNKGGTASGNCAAGFGVCCLFLVSASGSTISQNCTYIRNPGFPTAYTSTSALTFTVNKCSTDICWLRLDFETFNIVGPTLSTEAATTVAGGECPDQFKVTTNTGIQSSVSLGQSVPIICGVNTGQHIYVDIGTQSTDTATLSFTFSTATSTTRSWEIKVSQISCSNLNRPPNGCLQYVTTLQGRLTSFNFFPTTTTSRHLDNQLYNVCVRRAQGFCCIQYWPCEGVPNSFTLDNTVTAIALTGNVDSTCTNDYILIPGSANTCSASNQRTFTKYCGQYLGLGAATGINTAVCDCTGNFQVGIRTDNTADVIANTAISVSTRGLCLDFMQIPCTTN